MLIRRNHFVNSLTNMFQFTNAIISIYPEIPDLEGQQQYFHSGIVIEENEFETFDQPILYAKSVDGLTFQRNEIRQNQDYPAFHWNNHRFLLERVINEKTTTLIRDLIRRRISSNKLPIIDNDKAYFHVWTSAPAVWQGWKSFCTNSRDGYR